MDRQFRKDLIYERQRDTQEIRDRLAMLIRIWRKSQGNAFILGQITGLRWVLNQDRPTEIR
jgi:hypothetical protein